MNFSGMICSGNTTSQTTLLQNEAANKHRVNASQGVAAFCRQIRMEADTPPFSDVKIMIVLSAILSSSSFARIRARLSSIAPTIPANSTLSCFCLTHPTRLLIKSSGRCFFSSQRCSLPTTQVRPDFLPEYNPVLHRAAFPPISFSIFQRDLFVPESGRAPRNVPNARKRADPFCAR